MADQIPLNTDPNLPDWQTIIAILSTIGTAVLGVMKWLDTRKKSTAATKVSKEDWLIDNALGLVVGLQSEIARLKSDLEEERRRNRGRIEELEDKVSGLIRLLKEHNIDYRAQGNNV